MAIQDLTDNVDKFVEESGVTKFHVRQIADECKKRNVFLMTRPTEAISRYCIEQGFATKSMDVHHKSSNWGPMAGAVPVDPFFNKKSAADSKAEPSEDPTKEDDNKAHKAAKHVELRLSAAMVEYLEQNKYIKADGNGQYTGGPNIPADKDGKCVFFVEKDNKPGESRAFRVLWAKVGKLEDKKPVWVWGYDVDGKAEPVTGDYDVWMVAPHMSWWKLHTEVVVVEDEHGSSASTLFNAWFIEELNTACQRAKSPVFQHGAEAQNFGFAQAIDEKIAVFTPGGRLLVVDRGDLPDFLADLVRAQYLVYWNNQYDQFPPMRGGVKVDPKKKDPQKEYLEDKLKKVYGSCPRIEPFDWAAQGASRARACDSARKWENEVTSWAGKKEAADFFKEHSEDKAIFDFHLNFHWKLLLLAAEIGLPGQWSGWLGRGEGGHWFGYAPLTIQLEFQNKVVAASVNGGESSQELTKWLNQNPEIEEYLSTHFGPTPGPPVRAADFLLPDAGPRGLPVFKRKQPGKPTQKQDASEAKVEAKTVTPAPKSVMELRIADRKIDLSFKGDLA